MFASVFPHKVLFKEQKDEPIFIDFKARLKKYGLECINVYANFEKRNDKDILKLTMLFRNSLGIIPDDSIILGIWDELCEYHSIPQYNVQEFIPIYISADALALEKHVRDEKNKIYVSKLIQRNIKVVPYKVFAFNTAINNESNNERTGLYYYSSGYNIIFDTKEDYEKALEKKEEMVNSIKIWINKLCSETLHRKSGSEPIIRFLYRDLIADIEQINKENNIQF